MLTASTEMHISLNKAASLKGTTCNVQDMVQTVQKMWRTGPCIVTLSMW